MRKQSKLVYFFQLYTLWTNSATKGAKGYSVYGADKYRPCPGCMQKNKGHWQFVDLYTYLWEALGLLQRRSLEKLLWMEKFGPTLHCG